MKIVEFTAEDIENDFDVEKLVEGCDELVDLSKKSYRDWSYMGSSSDDESRKRIKEEMITRFNEGIGYHFGKKYIKVVTGSSVWGFVVAIHNDKKFRFGDILKAAGWNAPARNFPRGNVVDGDFRGVRWTGAM
jgi:hypothetical protein